MNRTNRALAMNNQHSTAQVSSGTKFSKFYKFCLKNAGPLRGGMVIEGTFLDLLRDPTNCMACNWATENSIETGVSFSS